MFLKRLALLSVLFPAVAFAQRDSTREALARLEESLGQKLEQSGLTVKDAGPIVVVSVAPAFEESKAWYPNAALTALLRVFGAANLRSCEACMVPRLFVDSGHVEENSAPPDVAEIVKLDESARGSGPPARTAVWLDETAEGVSLRVVDLKNSHILLAENFDPLLKESARTRRNITLSEELDRRARHEAIAHLFFDATLYPGQHVSLDWTEQWGDSNANLSGVTLSLFDPVLGIGGCYYRVIPSAFNLMVGVQVIMSLPTGLVKAVTRSDATLIDPLLTGVAVVRFPIASSNYGIVFTASTNGRFGLGISLMNISFLPFLP